MDEKAEDRVDRAFSHEPRELTDGSAELPRPPHPECGYPDARIAQLIGNRSPPLQTRDLDFHVRRLVQPRRQFPHDRRRAADLQVGDEQEDAPRHYGRRYATAWRCCKSPCAPTMGQLCLRR